MTQKQFGYTFKPSLVGALILFLIVPIFIKLGLWQYDKASLKQKIQLQYEQSAKDELTRLPSSAEEFSALQYKKVRINGVYETQHQILLDNQIENNQAGFHVITPLKIEGRNDFVLVNRGWIPSGKNRNDIPTIATPNSRVEVVGQLWLPTSKFFTLESDAQKNAQIIVWQHLDMARFQKRVPSLLPAVIKLDEKSEAGGFVRHWQMPASKIATNLGYAYQWFGFALASILIYILSSFKKRNI